ncbi:MAG: NAD(P)H-dependent glycerol-3-phosphate dehydrogenase [Firmicutes bacterium HGW-Firmicutes-13]|nr:MAG: NAD(P)H-dependent glycerol-3-phosphate dehydrogenase [Firmicutes bacterium HGW-Firmicutes-13]
MNNFSIVGAGGWGTALSLVLTRKGFPVKLWVRTKNNYEQIKEERENNKYLPGIYLPKSVQVCNDLQEVVEKSRMVVVVVPSHVLRKVVLDFKKYIHREAVIVSAAKGIETDTLLRMSQVLKEELDSDFHSRIAVLSGPNHAEEVSREIPSATVVASEKREAAEFAQDVFMSPSFRVYTNPDIVGIELAGALKNIIALGSGVSDGLGFGDNTKAALMTRGLVEISRLGISMGAKPLTFAGLAGIGDLIATCTSKHSRNRRAGMLLGEGKTHEDILESMDMVVEGFKTTLAASKLAEKQNIDMPITREVYEVVFNGKSPRKAVIDLMTRGKKNEVEEIVTDNLKNW